MRERRREVAIPLALGAGAFALAFAQRPGLTTADTKINLHVDPGRFLADVASMWTSTGQLGDVQAGQQAGYLFPMGPFFALGHALGVSDWVVQRLWLGTLLALAAWGVVRLLDALRPGRRGVAHLVAGAAIILNPFVVTYVNRTTVTLLAYAALPWLLLAVHRGLRDPRGWRWPAAVALLVTASGGGINGAVTAWMLLGPALLLLYEVAFTPVRWRAAGRFLVRAAPLTLLASLWWIVPAYIQSSYGIDFLHFTEQPGTVWGTTSATESLRLMSFWLSYVGIGFDGRAIPYFDDARTLLFSAPVVVATLLLPAAALTGFVWTRRWTYGPFFLGLALVAVLVMMAGFPDGTPLRHGLTFAYNHVASVRFLRASYKAAPLLAVALACLGGVAAAEALIALGRTGRGVAWQAGAAAGIVLVLVLAAWPLVSGRAQDAQVSFRGIPTAWRAAAADLDRQLPANSRAIVLPGDLFSFYTWGGTVDPILPALTRRPVAERTEVPYADMRATDLLWTIDSLVHQQRLLPMQLAPLLSLIGARSVISGTDDDLARSDAPAPADAAAVLAVQPGFAQPAKRYGPLSTFTPSRPGPAVTLPQVRRYDLPSGRGLVRVEPAGAPVIVDGSADGLAALAAFGGLAADRALLYSGDLRPAELRDQLRHGGELVITDSNRRRAFVAGSLDRNTGPTLAADQGVSADGIMLDPFGRGTSGETVATYRGIRSVQAPSSPEIPQHPEQRPFAAIDGSPATAWVADATLGPGRQWLQLDLDRPTDISHVRLLPYGRVRSVQIAGHTFTPARGWNTLTLGARRVSSLHVAVAGPGPIGIRELQIPGVSASESLRLPLDAAAALHGAKLDTVALTYLFERTTGAESTIDRTVTLPAARSFSADAWVTAAPQTPDSALDRLAGYRGPLIADSSSRSHGVPGWRASRALDDDPRTAWIADYDPARPAWISLRSPRALAITHLRLTPPSLAVRRPTRVQIAWYGGITPILQVGPGGVVGLPHPLRTRSLRITVVGADAPPGASAADRRAVGIGEIDGLPSLPEARSLAAPCGTASITSGAATVPLRVTGGTAAFDAGAPLRAVSCGEPVALPAGTVQVRSTPGPFLVDLLRLRSPAPQPVAAVAAGSGQVLDTGRAGRGSVDNVRIAVTRPSWLVLGEGYNRGWRAWCGTRSLGAPTPVDGYANGWIVSPGCTQVRFAFTPNRRAEIGYIVSALAGIACLLLVLAPALPGRRRRPESDELDAFALAVVEHARPWRPERAAAWALLLATAFAFVFGVKAGIVSAPVIGLVLWRGIGARTLTLCAGLLLGIVVPVLYLVHPGRQAPGNHFGYAAAHMAAHWCGVAAIGLLMLALWRTLAAHASASPARRARAERPQERARAT